MKIPKFGMTTNPCIEILEEIKFISNLGADFVEICMEEPFGTTKMLSKKKKLIQRLLNDCGLFALGHAPWWAELGTTHDTIRKAWINESKEIINMAIELEMQKLNFHTHCRGLALKNKKSKKEILNNYITSLTELGDYAENYNLMIVVENPVERGEITEFEDFKRIIDEVDNVWMTLDVGHAFVRGGMNIIKKYIRELKHKIKHMHFSDNHGEKDEHLPLGAGIIDYKIIIKKLKNIRYTDTVTLEIHSKDRDLAKFSMEKLKKLWS